MTIKSPNDFFANELREIYSAEKLLMRSLPKLSKSVHSDAVRSKLQERIEQGRSLIEDVDSVFEEMELSKGRKKNEAIEGLLEDATQLVDEIKSDKILDTALIGAVQKIEHYCLAAWGTVAALGRTMDQKPVVEVFERALESGKKFDKDMTDLAVSQINPAMFQDSQESKGGKSASRS